MQVSVRVLLCVLVIVVSLLVCLTTFIPLYLSGEDTGEHFISTVRKETIARLSAEVWSSFAIYHPVVSSVNSVVRVSRVSANEGELIGLVCDHYSKVNQSSFLGLEDGRFVKCVSYSEGTYHAQVRHITYRNEYVLDANFSIVSSKPNVPQSSPYDPRIRPWYKNLIARNGYSNLYTNFSNTNTTVLTIGGPVFLEGVFQGVFAVDVFPQNVLNYLEQLNLEHAKVFLCEDETLNLLGGSAEGFQERLDAAGSLTNLTETDDPSLSAVRGSALEAMKCPDACSESHGSGRDKGYVDAQFVDPSKSLRIKILVLAEERTYLGRLWSRFDLSIGIVFAVLVALVVATTVIANLLLKPLHLLGKQVKTMTSLQRVDSQEHKPSVLTEIRTLQEAFHRLSDQLTQLKAFVPQNVLQDDEYFSSSQSTVYPQAADSSDNSSFWNNPNAVVEPHEVPVIPAGEGEEEPMSSSPRRNAGSGSQMKRSESWDVDDDSPKNHEDKPAPRMVTWEAKPTPNAAIENDGAVYSPTTRDAIQTQEEISFKLNNRRLQQEINKFKLRKCTVLVAELALHRCSQKQEVESEVSAFMEAVIGTAMLFRGTVQLIRPEVIVVSFNTVMHETKAVKAALGICSLMRNSKLLSVAIDSSEYFVGNCGAKERFANAIFGPMYQALRSLPELIRHFKGTSIILTESTANAARVEGYTAFPVDVLSSRFTKAPIKLFDIAPTAGFSADMCRKGFGLMQAGSVSEAQVLFEYGEQTNPHCSRLIHRIASKSAQRLRKDVFPWEDLGDLQESINPEIVSHYAKRFWNEDDEVADAGLNQSVDVKQKIREAKKDLKRESILKKESEVGSSASSVVDNNDNGMLMFMPVSLVKLDDNEYDDGTQAKEEEEKIPDEFQDVFGENWHRSKLVLGKGGFGEVFQGMSDVGVIAAMKFVEIQAEMQTKDLETEVEALTKLQHENIVQLYSAAVLKRHLIFVLEYVPGGSLITTLDAYGGHLPEKVAKKFCTDILNGLRYLHSCDVVHCDIKPHNVLVAADGTCKITDFGSAVFEQRADEAMAFSLRKQSTHGTMAESTQMEDIRGTLKYMAPEVADSQTPTVSSDIWSFGVTMAHLYLGRLPWAHISPPYGAMAFMSNLSNATWRPELPENSEIPTAVKLLCDLCWAHNPDDRPTAKDILSHEYFFC